ncbi:hypothetical protein [Nocardia sp. CY41]|uniref:hypothetical protein n=1 Tax=Nocardia sp. CY41 TaxID=2608686 RepID=UPI0013591A8F|nr:hypothetical protein [Nocardia sp. CY41]
MLQTGDVFAGHLIERVLGRGGMDTVYLATRRPVHPGLIELPNLPRRPGSGVRPHRQPPDPRPPPGGPGPVDRPRATALDER